MQRRMLLQASLAAAGAAAAQPAAAASPTTSQGEIRSFVVEAVQMPAWIDPGGERQPLAPGDTVSNNQAVETGADAALVLRLPEGSQVRLGEKSRLEVPQLEVERAPGEPVQVRSRLRLGDGFLRFTTSVVGKAVGKREVEIGLRTATIGIRGTDFWTMTDAAHDAACLFEGRIDLATRDQGGLVLEQPTAFWARFFERPVQPVGNATPQELARFLGSTEPKPGRGIAVVGGRWRTVAGAPRDAAAAAALARRLREAGYPARVRAARGVHEVRIDQLATRQDAAAVLEKIAGIDGVQGRVELARG